MLNVRLAQQKDQSAIIKLLKELNLYYTGLKFNDFWLAEENHQIVACLQLEQHENFLFLGSMGVKQNRQKQGIGKALIAASTKQANKDIYLYTIIPNYFSQYGFSVTNSFPNTLPSKDRYECEYCHTDKCVVMVRHANT